MYKKKGDYAHFSDPSLLILASPAYLILARLVQGPKHAIALQEAIEQAEGLYIEPGTLYRVLAQLERRGWIETLATEQALRLYHLTAPGLLAFEQAEASRQGEPPWEREHPGLRQGKEIIMRLVLWILRLYPPAWRERYELEMVALLWQHHITLWTVLDLLVGALDARLDPHYRRPRQLLPLRRFQTSWRVVVGALAFFWIALLPWLWMSALGISDAQCNQWGNNYDLCTLRVTVGMQAASLGQRLVGGILGFLPLLLMAFMAILVLARGRKARTHLLLTLPVTIGMLTLCLACGAWLIALRPLLPHISQFYPRATAGLLAGLAGMGLATVLALGSLVRAAFALRAISAAAPRQESPPLSSNRQASEAGQGTDTAHLEPDTASASTGRASSVPKGWMVLLGLLLLLFVLPWPLLITTEDPDFWTLLVTWFFAGVVGLITALLVKSPGRKQAQRTARKPRRKPSPLVWAIFLFIVLFGSTVALPRSVIFGDSLPFFWGMFLNLLPILLFVIAICIIPALIVKIRNSNQQADRATRPLRNSTSPKVWIIISPVLFLVFCMEFEYIGLPDYPDFREVLIAWLLTGLASLIILLAIKPGSRASATLPPQEELQQVQVQV